MTECNQTQLFFEGHFSRQVVAEFSGEQISTDGGALLLREVDRKIGLLERVGKCFQDGREWQRGLVGCSGADGGPGHHRQRR